MHNLKINTMSGLFINSIQKNEKYKLNIFLDLDNTIINSLDLKELEELKKSNINYSNMKYYDYMDGNTLLYRVFERPNLQKFLDYLFSNFNVSVFTAASNDYASFIIKNIIELNGRKIKYFFWSYHSAITANAMKGLKDLDLLWNVFKLPNITPCNTLIIDDNENVYKTNKENCIRVPAFSLFDEETDSVNVSGVTDNYLLKDLIYILNNKRKLFLGRNCIHEKKHLHRYTKDKEHEIITNEILKIY